MRALLVSLSVATLVAALAGPALAQDIVILADGSTRKAEILEVLDDGIRVRLTPKRGGTAEVKVPAWRLDPHFFYNLADQHAGDDAKAHLRLALWAFDAGLFSRAKIQVERAAKLDPQLVKDIQEGKLPDIREKIAAKVLASAEKDIKDEKFELAETKLEKLLARMPDTEAGTAAVKVYDDLMVTMKEHQSRKEQEELDRMAEEEKRKEKELRRKTEPIKKDLERGRDLIAEGLTEDSDSNSLRLLRDGIRKGEEALKKIEKLREEFADDADLMARADEVTQKTIDRMVEAHLHRADIYTWRGSTKQAREEIDAARKLDPNNPDVDAAEVRIDERDDQDALELGWQRNRRAGNRFRGGNIARGGRRR